MLGRRLGGAGDVVVVDDPSSSSTPSGANWALSQAFVPALLFVACLAAQLYLVFYKSFNWDEFLHFSQIYQLKAGTLSQPFQVLHARVLWWAPEVATDLLRQMTAARLFMWSLHLFTLVMIYGVAGQFTDKPNAFFASFAYLTAGFVFEHGFSIRADPMVTATLMSALYLLAKGPLGILRAIAIGALVGLAGMMTLKSIFYVPCFAGLAWLKGREAPAKAGYIGKLAVLAAAALLTFGIVYLYHTSGLAEAPRATPSSPTISHLLRWVSEDRTVAPYVDDAMIRAPLFFFCVALAPIAWLKAGLKMDAKLALTGLIAPLAVLFFYRNTFPYFFVFILAPAAVAIAPALGEIRKVIGSGLLSVALAAFPLATAYLQPRDVIDRQRALIDYVHQEFPTRTGYLDYSGMIADYPRILRHLTSGIGIASYYERGNPIVGTEIDRGNVPFIIANHPVIFAALEGRPMPETFLPKDLAAISGNYVRQSGAIWREGKQIPSGSDMFQFQLRRGGNFVLDGGELTIDGVVVRHGERITLDKGSHLVSGERRVPSILWRGERLPSPLPAIPMDRLFTRF